MTENSWHRIGPLASLADGAKSGKYIQGQYIFLVRLGEEVFAYEDRCPHTGASLSDGRLQKNCLTCRHHLWQFDARTGQSIRPKGYKIKSYLVKIEDGDVFVSL
jgi:toluene monooxygenase system ferredoxin subunit